jgi:hypothetical protein
MAQYPIDPVKLLEVADELVPLDAGPGRPSYTKHRRAVSTAYYAAFHAITDRVVKAVFDGADDDFQNRVRKWVGHGNVRTVALWIAQIQGIRPGSPPPHIKALVAPSNQPPHIDSATLGIADGFLELNEKREQADYDHDAVFTRPDTLGSTKLAKAVVDTAHEAQSDEAKRFFGLIAMQAKIQTR